MNRAARAGRSTVVRRTVVRPTAFGVTATAVAVAVFAARSSINEPALAGLVWTVFVGLVVVGAVWPLVVVRFVRIEIVDVPTDAVAGVAFGLGVRLRSPGLVDTLALRIEGTEPWWSVPSGAAAAVELTLGRSVVESLTVTMSTDGPLGMLSVSRRVEVPLAVPLFVGPDPVHRLWTPPVAPETGSDEAAGAAAHGGDEVRSVRPYRSGDPAHLVHWPSSARVGSLVVREFEPPTRPGVVLVVDLGPAVVAVDGPTVGAAPDTAVDAAVDTAVERAVAEAAGLAAAVLAFGGRVLLCTHEHGGARTAEVATPLQARRRLAAATPGPVDRPSGPTDGATTTVVFAPGAPS